MARRAAEGGGRTKQSKPSEPSVTLCQWVARGYIHYNQAQQNTCSFDENASFTRTHPISSRCRKRDAASPLVKGCAWQSKKCRLWVIKTLPMPYTMRGHLANLEWSCLGSSTCLPCSEPRFWFPCLPACPFRRRSCLQAWARCCSTFSPRARSRRFWGLRLPS